MSTKPLVSIIVPILADDFQSTDAVTSSIAQTLQPIEVVVPCRRESDVDIVTRVDDLVRIVELPDGATAADARRVGVLSARGEYVVFLDLGDELPADAIARLRDTAIESGADVVALGAAKDRVLRGEDILRSLFPAARRSDVDLRAQMFRTGLLRQAYAILSDTSMSTPDERVVAFLAFGRAQTYVSLGLRLQRRETRAEDPQAGSLADFERAVRAVASVSAVEPLVDGWAKRSPDPEPICDGFDWLRLTLIAEALMLVRRLPDGFRQSALTRLRATASDVDILSAAASFTPRSVELLTPASAERLPGREVRHVMLAGDVVASTGSSGLLISQAALLRDLGLTVTIVTQQSEVDATDIPRGVSVVRLTGLSRRDALLQWDRLCRGGHVDIVLDHRVASSADWAWHALVARAAGVPTVGWVPPGAISLAPGGSNDQSLPILTDSLMELAVSSAQEVAFWKVRGLQHVSYLPPLPGPWLAEFVRAPLPSRIQMQEPFELLWWGTADDANQALDIASALHRVGADFRMRILGAGWRPADETALGRKLARRDLTERVELESPGGGHDVLRSIDSSDLLLRTKTVGSDDAPCLAAMTRGLPILTYHAPWQSPRKDAGVVDVGLDDLASVVEAVTTLAADPARYNALSQAAVETAHRTIDQDFRVLYGQLMSGSLPADFSPAPTIDDGRAALDLLIYTAENAPTRRASSPPDRAPGSRRNRRSSSNHRSFGAKLERRLTPTGHRLLDVAPWLRPFARQIKRALLFR